MPYKRTHGGSDQINKASRWMKNVKCGRKPRINLAKQTFECNVHILMQVARFMESTKVICGIVFSIVYSNRHSKFPGMLAKQRLQFFIRFRFFSWKRERERGRKSARDGTRLILRACKLWKVTATREFKGKHRENKHRGGEMYEKEGENEEILRKEAVEEYTYL